jgi:hypothetical protein
MSLGSDTGVGLPVIVQMYTSDGSCWQASFGTDDVSENDSEAFKAKF